MKRHGAVRDAWRRRQFWQRVTGRWVTVTGKRRELDLLITFYGASPAAVATPCPVLAAPLTAYGIPDCAV